MVSNLGWKAVEALRVGDKVLSFDHGMQTVIDVRHDDYVLPEALHYTDQCPVLVPEGALCNRRPLWLMPDQGILVESDIVMDDTGDPFAVLPAKSLVGHRGIELRPFAEEVRVTRLGFQTDVVIYVEGGVLAHCPMRGHLDVVEQTYRLMNLRTAKFLVDCHMDDPVPQGLTYHPDEVASALRRRGHAAN